MINLQPKMEMEIHIYHGEQKKSAKTEKDLADANEYIALLPNLQ